MSGKRSFDEGSSSAEGQPPAKTARRSNLDLDAWKSNIVLALDSNPQIGIQIEAMENDQGKFYREWTLLNVEIQRADTECREEDLARRLQAAEQAVREGVTALAQQLIDGQHPFLARMITRAAEKVHKEAGTRRKALIEKYLTKPARASARLAARAVVPRALRAEPAKLPQSMTLLFGTCRTFENGGARVQDYSCTRPVGELTYGKIEVTFPDTHAPGRRDGVLEAPELLEVAKFQEHLRAFVRAKPSGRHVLVFIHGFNVTFAESVGRGAQLTYDMRNSLLGRREETERPDFDILPCVFSWPSESLSVSGYEKAQNLMEDSKPKFDEFIETLTNAFDEEGGVHVHIIAHSMGNHFSCRTLDSKFPASAIFDKPWFKNMMFTAPDVSASGFREALRARNEPSPTGPAFHLYFNGSDSTLLLSFGLHGGTIRAGQGVIMGDADKRPAYAGKHLLDSIASPVWFDHSYAQEESEVLHDLADLAVLGKTNASQREAPRGGLVSKKVIIPFPYREGSAKYWKVTLD